MAHVRLHAHFGGCFDSKTSLYIFRSIKIHSYVNKYFWSETYLNCNENVCVLCSERLNRYIKFVCLFFFFGVLFGWFKTRKSKLEACQFIWSEIVKKSSCKFKNMWQICISRLVLRALEKIWVEGSINDMQIFYAQSSLKFGFLYVLSIGTFAVTVLLIFFITRFCMLIIIWNSYSFLYHH